MAAANDVYQMVTNKILEIMAQGKIPWERPYKCSTLACSHQTGEPYSLLNQMLLEDPGQYWTFQQAKKAGHSIRKGAKSKQIVFWKLVVTKGDDESEDGESSGNIIPYLKYYNVFHERDVEGLEKPNTALDETLNREENADCDAIINRYIGENNKLRIETRDGVPCYSPIFDIIKCPQKSQFISLNHYYATLFHEIIHSTGHKTRLDRDLQGRFGSSSYAREELVAEMGSAFLCCTSGIDIPEITTNKAAYIQSWSKKIQNDPKLFVIAASRAEAAVRFILGEEIKKYSEN